MKKIFGFIIIVAIVGGIAAILISNKKKMTDEANSTVLNDSAVLVSTYKVEEEKYTMEFNSNGTTQAVNELNFVSDANGRIVEIYVDKGSRVKKGTPLLKVETSLMEADNQAALIAYEALKKDEERFTNSNKVGGVTDQQLDNLKAQIAAAESRLARSAKTLTDATIKAPMTGTINARYIEVGSLIAMNAPLFDIVNDNKLKIICNVPEGRVRSIHPGQAVSVEGNTAQGESFTGRVSFVGIKTDRGLNYPVEVLLDEHELLHIGMYLKVRFSSEEELSGILIPRKAVVGSAKSANVYLVRDGKAAKQEVALGQMVGDRIEIVQGLNPGDEIIISGIMNVNDGSIVRTTDQ